MRRIPSVALALFTFTTLLSVNSTSAQVAGDPAPPAEEATQAAPKKSAARRSTLDLGDFKINDLRPTRNETAKLTFSLHLALKKDLTRKQVAQLERWKHRLRDQVITSVRIAATKDFQEPDLSRLRRTVLSRVNRLFPSKYADEVLLTEYLFRTH